jgi:hypothetical protein
MDLPRSQLTLLNDEMKDLSRCQDWQIRIDELEADGDDTKWQHLFSHVLIHLASKLAVDLKASIVPSQTLDQADEIVKSFSEDEFKEWKDGVQKGVKEGDWTDLIAHRTNVLHVVELLLNFSGSETSCRWKTTIRISSHLSGSVL